MARPQLWWPFNVPGVRPGYEYRRTDGAIRNGSRNILTDHFDGVHVWITLESPHGNRTKWNKRHAIARAHLGRPPTYPCFGCGRRIDIGAQVVHRSDNPQDCTPDGLTYMTDDDIGRQHELCCIEACMSARPHGTPRPGIRLPRYGFAA